MVILIVALCLASRLVSETGYRDAFPEWLFALGFAVGPAVCVRVLIRT